MGMMTAEERINQQGWTIMSSYGDHEPGYIFDDFIQRDITERLVSHSMYVVRKATRDEYTAEMLAMGARKEKIQYRANFYVVSTD